MDGRRGEGTTVLLSEVCPVSCVGTQTPRESKTPENRRGNSKGETCSERALYTSKQRSTRRPYRAVHPNRAGIHLIVLACPSISTDRSTRGICRVSWQIGIRARDPPVPDHVSCRHFWLSLRVRLRVYRVYVYITGREGTWGGCTPGCRVGVLSWEVRHLHRDLHVSVDDTRASRPAVTEQ